MALKVVYFELRFVRRMVSGLGNALGFVEYHAQCDIGMKDVGVVALTGRDEEGVSKCTK